MKDTSLRARARRSAKPLGRIVLLGGLAYAASRVVGSGMISNIGRASPLFLTASFGAIVAAHAMAAGRWWSLAPGHGYPRLARINLESHFWATFVPGGVAADGYRVLALRGRGSDPHHAAASVMIERALGLGVLLVLCGPALAVGAFWLSAKLLISLSVLAGVLLIMIAGGTTAALIAPIRRGRLMWLPKRLRSALGGVEEALGGYKTDRPRLLRAAGFALGYHGLGLLAYALAGRALGVQLPIGRWFVAVPLASLAATLPLNAWGIGLREGALVLLLVGVGVPPGQAAAVSVVAVGLQLALSCSGGLSQLAGEEPQACALRPRKPL